VNGTSGVDWPALTTNGPSVAGPGVSQKLLGAVDRPGVGDQVTYGGHPLYLFDLPSQPLGPEGEGYLETVAPMYPWHGIWYLVSAKDGRPAPGPAMLGTEMLPSTKPALAFVETALHAVPVTVYTFSLDQGSTSACTGACAVTWMPLLTTGKPQVDNSTVTSHLTAQDVGVIRRPDGTEQVTYRGKPLYLYSAERYIFAIGSPSSTAGNGNGLHGPNGGTFSVVDVGG
jgi:predicted lipoprotein with Yx(FWY)xxD motif